VAIPWGGENKRVFVKSLKKDKDIVAVKLLKHLRQLRRCEPVERTLSVYKYILLQNEIDNVINESLEEIQELKNLPLYITSSLFLQDSFALLNQKEVESLHFVTGPEINGIRVLDKIMDFRLEQQSIVYAKGDPEAVKNALIRLSRYNFRLWGYFHIHPGSGALSTFPSETDKSLDRLFDRGRYEAIGAIFSRDGYVRFFSSRKFKVQIYGEGVEKINERLYRLVEID
jgi:hypothetical protein